MDAQQTGLCKTSYKNCEGDIDFMATFPNTKLQSQHKIAITITIVT